MESTFWRSLPLVGAMTAVLGACASPAAGPNPAAVPSAAPNPAALPRPSKAGGSPAHLDSQESAAVADNKVVIAFPEGGATLTDTANRQLDVAARLYRDANPILMTVAGYTDSKGDEYGNLLLSARRARAVRQALIARGLPADRLLIQAFGQSDPANPTDPLAAANRRVVITWQLPEGPARGGQA